MDVVDVVLPCLDEAAALPGVLAALPAGYRAIVVDNGSTDGSTEIAARHGATVVPEPHRGYGAAVHTGLVHATAEIVCFLDADGSLDPAELPKLVAFVASGRARLAVGRRVPVARGCWPWHARAGTRVLAALLRRRGLTVTDIAPMRAARRADLLRLEVRDRALGYPLELLLRAAAADWPVVELDVAYRPRTAGTRSRMAGSVRGSVRGTVRGVRDMAGVLR
ncbi:MAG TPA: glycosyltransferase family 2 protein [Actinophytocola sp.]|uniref:glycosyltransferase family 2 protein n=1 Tax=Actinophytocola sp. TaxID=1872138 RepID=UPI002DBBAEBC|nr:glycosyltransferase family 2 protein [Actinophytocola sp.]HEU5475738.1 glycosyltransferase family 2 protein [Actinophytocola sp.]